MEQVVGSRFDFEANVENASSYTSSLSPFWPPAESYRIAFLDLAEAAPAAPAEFYSVLARLRSAIESEWAAGKSGADGERTRFLQPEPVAKALVRIADLVEREVDRTILLARAQCVAEGYSDEALAEMATPGEQLAVVAAKLATWYGKEVGGRPTAFACRRNEELGVIVDHLSSRRDEAAQYLRALHADLELRDIPVFAPSELFFMAGEGNLHPKHIAYFLPADEGVKRSSFKKTYYFANTHRTLLSNLSWPLFDRHVELEGAPGEAARAHDSLPCAGVLAHEAGHFVLRPHTSFKDLNAADRWASVTLQEVAADVFGTLIVAEVFAESIGASAEHVLAYYLAECVRYAQRGLGFFPDSDGMLLQLDYLVSVGALDVVEDDAGARLRGSPAAVLAGLRSLARVLTDSLLSGDVERTCAIYAAFGPRVTDSMRPILARLAAEPPCSVEYLQEHIPSAPEAEYATSASVA
jgi:hypothetical protein